MNETAPAPPAGLLVLDANVVIGWCFGRRLPERSRALLALVREQGALAPDLLRKEVEAVVGKRARGGSLSEERVRWFGDFFASLPIVYDGQSEATGYAEASVLAERWALTVKDAAYLELALRENAALATSDRALKKATRRAGGRLYWG